MAFFLETLLGGLMAGMLYSLVALGFVLIFKASGVFNFAQGAMVLVCRTRHGPLFGVDPAVVWHQQPADDQRAGLRDWRAPSCSRWPGRLSGWRCATW